jgi:hypothetical protein
LQETNCILAGCLCGAFKEAVPRTVEKLAVRMDQNAELIDKAMVPINKSILLIAH